MTKTKTEIENKWAPTLRVLELTDDEKSCQTDAQRLTAVLKTKLRIAIHYLINMDEHDSKYKAPFTGNQFKWALAKPVAQDKVDKAVEWCHQCYELQKRACLTWTY